MGDQIGEIRGAADRADWAELERLALNLNEQGLAYLYNRKEPLPNCADIFMIGVLERERRKTVSGFDQLLRRQFRRAAEPATRGGYACGMFRDDQKRSVSVFMMEVEEVEERLSSIRRMMNPGVPPDDPNIMLYNVRLDGGNMMGTSSMTSWLLWSAPVLEEEGRSIPNRFKETAEGLYAFAEQYAPVLLRNGRFGMYITWISSYEWEAQRVQSGDFEDENWQGFIERTG